MKFFCFALILVNMFSCQFGNESQEVLSQDEMADILNDITLAEGFVESYLFKDSALNKDSAVQAEIDKALQLRQVSTSLFTRSYRHYQSHPDQFKLIADTANARASRARDNSYSRRVIKPS
ncbi:MAG: hypothetical protein RLZZ172_2093 [Bacteroidota bacterium]|jgi:hypothetical protein